MTVLLLDNYDSFTYNLYQYLCELGADVVVHRNDKITLDDVDALNPERIVISPGPKTPKEAGISVDLIQHFAGKIPILGVCLGHQCVGAAFGGKIVNAGEIKHGKVSAIKHDGKGVYQGIDQDFEATRYHSLAVDPASLPNELYATAWSESGVIMGLRHKQYPVEGVQFHPESIMTDVGHDLLQNFLNMNEAVPAP
jgi:anthranilate synthase/aminodeoxychorismate synthase-like glutamine amidotransferase